MKIAILGGSFNPIGNHHIDIANKLTTIMDEVWLMPCYTSTTGKKLESNEHRVNMCNMAITNLDNPKIKLCLFEIDNKSNGKTYDVMKPFYKLYETQKHTFYFVIGMDNALTIHTWDNYIDLIKLVPFIVLNRNGYNNSGKKWFNKSPHIYLDDVETLDGSSTMIRNNLLNGITPEIDLDVYKYIMTNKLYWVNEKN